MLESFHEGNVVKSGMPTSKCFPKLMTPTHNKDDKKAYKLFYVGSVHSRNVDFPSLEIWKTIPLGDGRLLLNEQR